MIKKRYMYLLLFIIVIMFSVLILYQRVNKNHNGNIQAKNEEFNRGSNIIPDLYVEYNGKKIKGTRIDENYNFERLEFEEPIHSINDIFSSSEFYELWNMNEEQEIIDIKSSENIYYMKFYTLNKSNFSIEKVIGLVFSEGSIAPSMNIAYKDGIIISENNGNSMVVGISCGKPGGKRVSIYKLHFDDIGDIYYSFKFNCIE